MGIADLLAALRASLAQTDITLYPGATVHTIRQFEKQLDLTLPADFRAFYSCCDGFESATDLFRMVPLEEILTYPGTYQPPHRFTIAECLIYCDTWDVELLNGADAYRIVHAYQGQQVVLTHSLTNFLQRFLQRGVYAADGLYDWSGQLSASGPAQ